MKRFTERQLYDFVCRADSHEKIQIASDFLVKLDYISNDLFDSLMDCLAYASRELYWQENHPNTARW